MQENSFSLSTSNSRSTNELEYPQILEITQHFQRLNLAPERAAQLWKFVRPVNVSRVCAIEDTQSLYQFLMGHLIHPGIAYREEVENDILESLLDEILEIDWEQAKETCEIRPKTNPIPITECENTFAVPVFVEVAGVLYQIFTGSLVEVGLQYLLVFVTNAHCVVGCRKNNWRPFIVNNTGIRYHLVNGRYPKGYLDPRIQYRTTYDYGVFYFENPPDFGEIHRTMRRGFYFSEASKNGTIANLHTNFGTMRGNTEFSLQKREMEGRDIYLHKCITAPGYSGSPVFLPLWDNLLIGIHVGGYDAEHNRMCLLTQDKLNDLVNYMTN